MWSMRDKVRKLNINGAFWGLLLICVIFTIASPSFLQGYNLMNIARQCSINLIAAVGMTFVILTGGIDLSVGGVMALVGTITASILSKGTNLVLCLVIGLVIGMVFGVFNGVCIAYAKIPPFITTMATLSIARSIALMYSGGYPITGLPSAFAFIGTGNVLGIPVPVILAVVTVVFGVFILRKTVLGKYIYAIGGNEEATRLSGIHVELWKISVYAIYGLLLGIAGIVLTARMNSGQPSAASGVELDIIAAVVIGGTSLSGGEGGMAGTVIGTLVITVLNNGLTLMDVNPYLQGLIIGFVILGAVFIDKKKSKHA